MGIAIWLLPRKDHYSALQSLMIVRGKDTDGVQSPSSYPRFVPHITLASLPSKPQTTLSELFSQYKSSLWAKVASLAVGSVYFRSVYLAIHLSPQLAQLHTDIHAKLGIEPKTPSFPHMSLAYIDDKDVEERNKFAKTLVAQSLVRDNGGTEAAIRGSEETAQWMGGIDIAEAWLVDCTGPVETWKVLENVSLIGE